MTDREKVIEKLAEDTFNIVLGFAQECEIRMFYHSWSECDERVKDTYRNHARQLLADNPGLAVVDRDAESTDWMKEAGYVKEIKE